MNWTTNQQICLVNHSWISLLTLPVLVWLVTSMETLTAWVVYLAEVVVPCNVIPPRNSFALNLHREHLCLESYLLQCFPNFLLYYMTLATSHFSHLEAGIVSQIQTESNSDWVPCWKASESSHKTTCIYSWVLPCNTYNIPIRGTAKFLSMQFWSHIRWLGRHSNSNYLSLVLLITISWFYSRF